MGYPYHEFGWESLIFGGLMMALFWGGLIALFVWLFRASMGPKAHPISEYADTENHYAPPRNALEILKERYARGEISKVEFEEMCNDLRA